MLLIVSMMMSLLARVRLFPSVSFWMMSSVSVIMASRSSAVSWFSCDRVGEAVRVSAEGVRWVVD